MARSMTAPLKFGRFGESPFPVWIYSGRRTPLLGQGGVAARSRRFREATAASRRRGGC